MTFLKDAWYCAGFGDELTGEVLKSITVLSVPLVLFRDAQGHACALHDRCPHRFAPLSTGVLQSGELQCRYHGLRFDGAGKCTLNPHGNGAIPQAAEVRSYALRERYGALWVWMGDPDLADESRLPDFSEVQVRPGRRRLQGCLPVKANYLLIADNLLDLSHVRFLHPFLASGGPPSPDFRANVQMRQDGETVHAINEFDGLAISALFRMLWPQGHTAPPFVDVRANVRWNAPALLLLDTGAKPMGQAKDLGPAIASAHWLTPETEFSTHYFWANSRDTFINDPDMDAEVFKSIETVFGTEDLPMIEACQQRMGVSDLMSLKPVLLPTDGPALRARRIFDTVAQRAAV